MPKAAEGAKYAAPRGTHQPILSVQVRDNYLQGEQAGIEIVAVTKDYYPFLYADLFNIMLINNTVDGSQQTPMSITSVAKLLIQDTKCAPLTSLPRYSTALLLNDCKQSDVGKATMSIG